MVRRLVEEAKEQCMKILKRVGSCHECPNRRYGSGGRYDCVAVDAPLPQGGKIPEWCPLSDDPAQIAARAGKALADARVVLAIATQEAADNGATPTRLRELLTSAANQLTQCE